MARLKPPMLTNQQIGKWSVGDSFQHSVHHYRMYKCVCECGTEKDVKHDHLVNGKTKSCGCSWTTHGMTNTNEYRVWDAMVRRCLNKKHHAFKDYGGRGITVCDKWLKFEGFFEDMGNQPQNMQIERVDNSLGYFKENCKWTTVTEQARNRRSTKLSLNQVKSIKELIANGVAQELIASQFGVSRSNIGHIAQGATWRT
jgi:predicted XRE-type DNA-binding protein